MPEARSGVPTTSLPNLLKAMLQPVPGRWLALLLASLVLAPQTNAETRSAVADQNPTPGTLLVASPEMADPRFRQSVVLLLEHGQQGTLGVIINRATDVSLTRALPDLEVPGEVRHTLYFGGPVGLNSILFLIRSKTPPERAQKVINGVFYSSERATLDEILTQRPEADDLRFYVGHAGWAPGQLTAEIALGDWSLIEGDASTLFDSDSETTWPRLIKRLPPPSIHVEAPRALGHTASWSENSAPAKRKDQLEAVALELHVFTM